MPRANRHSLPCHVWHITRRCHKWEFLLKFSRDRERWCYWLFQAKKRYGFCVLNYIVTSNHIHLLVIMDTGDNVISRSMQLIAGRTAQEYNQRKQRKGAYWEDRYFATAMDTDEYLARCLIYVDMNMVRAGVVTHPGEWKHSGYHEIQSPPKRYRIIDRVALALLLGLKDELRLQVHHQKWINETLSKNDGQRQKIWSKSVAVGSQTFVKNVIEQMSIKTKGRSVHQSADLYQIKERTCAYTAHFGTKKNLLSQNVD
ncbi:transposase IS200 like protein [bacterium BMS3Abin11]|nr:transposase IS200 like protein [bacterium BMS3Abin11]